MVALARGLEHGVHGPMAVADLERRFDRMRDESLGCPGCSQRLQASSQPCRDRSRESAPAAVRVRSVDAASGQLGHLVCRLLLEKKKETNRASRQCCVLGGAGAEAERQLVSDSN